ncbi:hypothetical protein BY996DRAFT_6411386 [Phakopsora pachyrhizi]|nr:hypothetical protein BY996DRAFT_6411386 [Phakopsora pachyrhizi]
MTRSQNSSQKRESNKLIEIYSQTDYDTEESSLGPFIEKLPNGMGWMKVNNFRACKHCRQSHIKCSIAQTGGPCNHCRHRKGPCELPERCDKREISGWTFAHDAEPFEIYRRVLTSPSRKAQTPIEQDERGSNMCLTLDAELLRRKLQWLLYAPSRFRKRSSPMSWLEADDSKIKISRRVETSNVSVHEASTSASKNLKFVDPGVSSPQLSNPSQFMLGGSKDWAYEPSQRKKRKLQRSKVECPLPRRKKNNINSKVKTKNSTDNPMNLSFDQKAMVDSSTSFNEGIISKNEEFPNWKDLRDTESNSCFSTLHRMSIQYIVSPSSSNSSFGADKLNTNFSSRPKEWKFKGENTADSQSSISVGSYTRSPSLETSDGNEFIDNTRIGSNQWFNYKAKNSEKSSCQNFKTCQLPSLKKLFTDQIFILPPISNLF